MVDPIWNAEYVDRVVAGWCRYYDIARHREGVSGPREDWWAVDATLGEFARIRPTLPLREAWDLALKLVEAAPSEKVLATVGASPIEDLLSAEPYEIVDWIEEEAPENQRLRRALTHVWRSGMPEDVFERVQRLAAPDLG